MQTLAQNRGFLSTSVLKAANQSDAVTKARANMEKDPSFFASCDFQHNFMRLQVLAGINRSKFSLAGGTG